MVHFRQKLRRAIPCREDRKLMTYCTRHTVLYTVIEYSVYCTVCGGGDNSIIVKKYVWLAVPEDELYFVVPCSVHTKIALIKI